MMGLLDFFFTRRDQTAGIAKERLQIVLAHERADRAAPEFLPSLQRDLIAVVNKYLAVKQDLVKVNVMRQGGASVLEINIEFEGNARPAAPPEPAPVVAPVAAKPAAASVKPPPAPGTRFAGQRKKQKR